ncbi:FtsX-like permease family protein [Mucilaginibacter corticis]|uniref:FtsX-like permease family protein n=1 Tax=Mucilaginibacter corticis TaxID=2597670 RepID=A0A556MWE4_9SPHI|nr:ABC transporter permease [Mucilaginibacter corticis]TSJ44183.1 FtsX-like permease family protein [Mucilaginibacter corticis]
MIKNYIKIAWRSLSKNKFTALINIGGLSIGMAVALLIGLWVYNEFTFDHYHKNYKNIVRVIQNETMNGEVNTNRSLPMPLGYQLSREYQHDFKAVVMVRPTQNVLTADNRKLRVNGMFMQAKGPEMFTLRRLKGSLNTLSDPSSVILSASLAKALFGDVDPINRPLKIDNKLNVKVAGVYEDLPKTTSLKEHSDYIASWELYMTTSPDLKDAVTMWGRNSWAIYAELQPNADINVVNTHIKDLKMKGLALNHDEVGLSFKAQLFLQRMGDWRLYQEFKNGKNVGGEIQFVKMFIMIGVFVLLLACINFMNLSTARSEKRAKEVGIRKAIGSLRSQLVAQFYAESLLLAFLAFFFALLMVQLSLTWFNQVAQSDIHIPYTNYFFWLLCIFFTVFTGVLAGSYPALYLSSFNPVKVLKGTFKAGQMAAIPRKALVVVQFAVSVALIIGTVVIFMEVNYSKDRPVGYSQKGLLLTQNITGGTQHYEAFKHDLITSGAVAAMSIATSPVTEIWNNFSGLSWEGKDPKLQDNFGIVAVSRDHGATVGWKIMAGRDFSPELGTDSSAIIINESAAHFMNLKNPLGKIVHFDSNYTIIGIVKDVVTSPFEPAKPTLYGFLKGTGDVLQIRVNPKMSMAEALPKIKKIYNAYDPESPFDYHFVDTDYAKKFATEERVGKLAGVFTILAIFISCLGLFGMASFVAEQRKKEIGVRKVLGASVVGLWRLLSTEFVVLVTISLLIAMPLANYFMQQWLSHYTYRVELSWWIFALTGAGALLITLATVSWQTVKASLANPVNSLKSE